MREFAKIFVVNDGKNQLLITKDYDEEEESFCIKLTTNLPNDSSLEGNLSEFKLVLSVGYDDQQSRDSIFNSFSNEKADSMFRENFLTFIDQ